MKAQQPHLWTIVLTAICGLLLLFLPQRDYPVIDEWIYAQAARHIQVTGWFAQHDWSLTSVVAQAWWGSVFATLFGFSLKTLTASTLVLSWLGVVCFYFLLRHLDVPASLALFGALLLLLNPVYFHLSYSFMTDVAFIALVLAATLCAVLGLQRDNDRLLLVAMLITSLAVLVRQPGLLVAVALGIYFLQVGRFSRPRMLIVLIPVLVFAVYMFWQQAQPFTSAADVTNLLNVEHFRNPAQGLLLLALQMLLIGSTLGLWLLPLAPAIFRDRLPLRWAALALTLAAVTILIYPRTGGPGILMPLDGTGSVLQSSGFLITSDVSVLPPSLLLPIVWGIISLLMVVTTAWLGTGLSARLLTFAPIIIRSRNMRVVDFVYLVGLLMGLAPFLATQKFDRYFLPLLPFLILLLLRRAGSWEWRDAAIPGTLLLALGAFTILAQADFQDRAAAHWVAANRLVAQGVPARDIAAGFEWYGSHHYDDLGDKLAVPPSTDHAPEYMISDSPLAGFVEVGEVAYYTRLGGFTWRHILLLALASANTRP